ncbi:alginate export family protein [Caulobacter endophyticus]|uniref:Alginate export domain-containing protein n=1 Tax=Caulobacter endophyticus TaxID=2172652 RepID=A0A2T9KDS9_9CAUL|nr:alginate export family protein [Caulobacter endophyticus]PVM94103.1 hypothetical protein DDF67_00520 [Caulobacter endophyticus]
MRGTKAALALGTGLVAALWGAGANAQAAGAKTSAGKPILELRLRYEGVDQANFAKDARAITLRTRLGWETGAWKGLKGLVELEDVRALGGERYAVNVPGATTPPLNGADKARYPVVNDPEVTELNRAQVSWTPSKAVQVVVGRQRILLDDQRFVGAVAWRQDEQTFDAVRIDGRHGQWSGTYAYVTRVNRILGDLRDWNSDSHLANVAWTPSETLKLQGFVYALDFQNSPVNSSITRGLKATGKAQAGPYRLAYSATFARQSDWHGNTASYDLDYLAGEAAATFDIYTARLGYERLEGDGTRGFTTPLGTVHAFNGWSDSWVSPGGNKSFADGLRDLNLGLSVKPRLKARYFSNADLLVRWHDFDDQRTGADLGQEWEAQLTAAITPRLALLVKYADFRREAFVPAGTLAPPPSRTKAWLSLEYKL